LVGSQLDPAIPIEAPFGFFELLLQRRPVVRILNVRRPRQRRQCRDRYVAWPEVTRAGLAPKLFAKLVHRVALHRAEDVRVSVHGHADRGVAEKLLDDSRMNTDGQQQRRRAVAQVVKPRLSSRAF
jgi:hypothetical protein